MGMSEKHRNMARMTRNRIVIVGGGIAGLAAAFACSRVSQSVHVIERADRFGEVGAGIQIGPNVTRILLGWGLADTLSAVAAFPPRLAVRSAISARELAARQLGESIRAQFGAPYATVHRADLHQLLLGAVQAQGLASLALGSELRQFVASVQGVELHLADGASLRADILLGADGLWSPVRQRLLDDGAPTPTGHLAYRAMVKQSDLPQALRSEQVTVWLGPRMHVVQYPVRGGQWLNVVAIVEAQPDWLLAANATPGQLANWNQLADVAQLRSVLQGCCAPLRDLVDAIDSWRLWVLCDREPMGGPHEHALGRVALIGDAAHPMRPYLAQGAGMAIEDAAAMGAVLADAAMPADQALQVFAGQRWQRNREVQQRARRNGQIFHARGLLRLGRDAALALLGRRLLDLSWLYRH